MSQTTRGCYIGMLWALAIAAPWTVAADTGAEPTAQTIMERNFDAVKIWSLDSQATMVLTTARGEQRKRKMTVIQKLRSDGVNSNIRIRFLDPSDIAGTTFLQIQNAAKSDDQWIYLPALHKTRRLGANSQRDSFFGSDFSYGDILLPKVSLYSHAVLRSEVIKGRDCYVIESKPLDASIREDYGYARKLNWIDKASLVEAKVEYYDVEGTLLKTQTTADVNLVDAERGRWLVLNRTMINHQTGHTTLFQLGEHKVGAAVAEEVFSSNRLDEN